MLEGEGNGVDRNLQLGADCCGCMSSEMPAKQGTAARG
jgi:hypothetical protein